MEFQRYLMQYHQQEMQHRQQEMEERNRHQESRAYAAAFSTHLTNVDRASMRLHGETTSTTPAGGLNHFAGMNHGLFHAPPAVLRSPLASPGLRMAGMAGVFDPMGQGSLGWGCMAPGGTIAPPFAIGDFTTNHNYRVPAPLPPNNQSWAAHHTSNHDYRSPPPNNYSWAAFQEAATPFVPLEVPKGQLGVARAMTPELCATEDGKPYAKPYSAATRTFERELGDVNEMAQKLRVSPTMDGGPHRDSSTLNDLRGAKYDYVEPRSEEVMKYKIPRKSSSSDASSGDAFVPSSETVHNSTPPPGNGQYASPPSGAFSSPATPYHVSPPLGNGQWATPTLAQFSPLGEISQWAQSPQLMEGETNVETVDR